MNHFNEAKISKAILSAYHERFLRQIESDVVVVGAGPAGLTAAMRLAQEGFRVTVLEKRLAPGGGIWGGAIGMNVVVVQNAAAPVLEAIGVRYERCCEELRVVDAAELACALCLKAIQAGAVLLNLITVEDVCVQEGRVSGVVVNRSMISGALPVDPLTLTAKAVVDATGHEAAVVENLRKRELVTAPAVARHAGEGPMDAMAGEAFVVDHVAEVYPGLWVAGMSVCATLGGPRMGPIFGGMLLSGAQVAERVAASLRKS